MPHVRTAILFAFYLFLIPPLFSQNQSKTEPVEVLEQNSGEPADTGATLLSPAEDPLGSTIDRHAKTNPTTTADSKKAHKNENQEDR